MTKPAKPSHPLILGQIRDVVSLNPGEAMCSHVVSGWTQYGEGERIHHQVTVSHDGTPCADAFAEGLKRMAAAIERTEWAPSR